MSNYEVKVIRDIMASMRDGVELACDLYRPDNDEKYPVILMRTPYGKFNEDKNRYYSDPYYFASNGYNVVIQDVRGSGNSKGILKATGESEINDGYDTVEWAAVQEWSNGNIGMIGLSYFGFTQLAAAETQPPHLKAISPFQIAGLSPFGVNKSKVIELFHLMWIYTRVLDRVPNLDLPETEKQRIMDQLKSHFGNMDASLKYAPLRETPAAHVEGVPELQSFLDLLDGIEDPEFWKRIHRPLDFANMNVPMLHLTGWFDIAKNGTLDNYSEAMRKSNVKLKNRGQKLVVGPWIHGGELLTVHDGVDFGAENNGFGRDIAGLSLRWYDHWLKGIDSGILDDAPVSIFILGDNVWRKENEWPLARTRYTEFYLHSKGNANTLNGDGKISISKPGEEVCDEFVYDPANPVSSVLTNFPMDPNAPSVFVDQTPNQLREDVLVYTTDAFEKEMEITGKLQFKLFAATDAVDTDFTCRLTEVNLEGKAFTLGEGIVRARYRNSIKPEMLKPGEIYEYIIDIGYTGKVIKPGYKLRIEISSSSFPAYDRNFNTGESTGRAKTYVSAHQKIYHNAQYPSCLILPVIPR